MFVNYRQQRAGEENNSDRRQQSNPASHSQNLLNISGAYGRVKLSIRELLDVDEDDGGSDAATAEADLHGTEDSEAPIESDDAPPGADPSLLEYVRSGGLLFLDGTRSIQLSDIAGDTE